MNNVLLIIARMIIAFTLLNACKDSGPSNSQGITIKVDIPVTDYDGNVYSTVKIGNQIWMAENLRVKHYSDGIMVESFCYENDTLNAAKYGRLYKWNAALRNSQSEGRIQGVAPAGWHLPSEEEWQELINNLGGEAISGGKLKATGLPDWLNSNNNTTNESGFNLMPGGFYRVDGKFMAIGEMACLLTTRAVNQIYRKIKVVTNSSNRIISQEYLKEDAVSVRCIKD